MDTAASGESRIVGGRYRLLSTLGTGGMGTVWRGRDEILRRPVAVKEVTLPRGLPAAERDLLCERTLREARAAAALNHPAVIRVFDVVEDDNRPWIVMELLEARSVAEIVREDGPLPVHQVASIGLAVLGALETAHAAGVLHRDVKPANVMVDAEGRTTLTDFGVARTPGESPLTSTGLLLGSPQYIAPERARGQAFGPASDLWSLGATLYAAVEGRAPFDHGDPLPTMTAIVSDPPAPMTLAGPLAPVLAGLLTKEPGQRSDHARARAGFTAVLNHTAPPKTTDPLPALPVSPPPMRAHPTAPLRRPPGHTPGPRRSRRRGAVAAAMVGLALLFCVGAYAIGSNFARDTGGGGGGTAGAAQSLRYVSYRHPDGFTVDVPAGWTPRDGTPVRVSSPGKPVWLQLHAETFGSRDPAAVWRAADRSNRNDAGSSARNPEYELVNIRATRAADRSAADWEWTYLRTGESERRHVLSRGVVVAGRSYQFSVSAPESLFEQYRGILDVVANSFRLTSSG